VYKPIKATTETSKYPDVKRRYEMLSHDLRTALGGVTGNLGRIDLTSIKTDDRALIQAAQESARMMHRFLEDIEASFQNEDDSTPPVELNSITIEDLFAQIAAQWGTLSSASGFDLHMISSEPVTKTISLDVHRVKRVVGNALQNSIKYGSGGRLLVEMVQGANGQADLSIGDEGPGFSPEALEILFTYSGRPTNTPHAGRGLGLYIAKTLTEEMSGKISARNKPAGGAEIRVVLPNVFGEAETQAKPTSSVAIMPNAALPDLSGFKILLAEDNVTNQIVVAQMLDAMGATYTVASDGIEGLDRIEAENFDLVLVDIEMPRLSGLDLIRQVRARSDKKATLPLVAFTAYAMREHRNKIAEAGADGLIAKPVTGIEDLGNAILRYLPTTGPLERSHQQQDLCSETQSFVVDEQSYARLEASIGSENMAELLKRVEEDLREVRGKLEKAIQHDQIDFAQRASHVLISVAGAIGATPLQHTAQRLNTQCHSENPVAIESATNACLNGIDSLLEFVQKRDS